MANFQYSELATDDAGRLMILVRDGESYLKVRRPIPIPRQSLVFEIFVLDKPMTLGQVTARIYGDVSLWGLVAEWNVLPDPASWLARLLPSGYKLRYLSPDDYKRFVQRLDRPTLQGVGDVEGDDS